MKKLLVAIALAGLFCVPAFAQDVPKAEVYGGFSVFRTPLDVYFYGGVGAVEFNLNEKVGIVGEFGFNRRFGANIMTFMGGPRFSYRADKVRVFFHGLVGGVRYGFMSTTRFEIAPGGGVDININDNIAVRPAQFDIMMDVMDGIDIDFRYSGGVVFKL